MEIFVHQQNLLFLRKQLAETPQHEAPFEAIGGGRSEGPHSAERKIGLLGWRFLYQRGPKVRCRLLAHSGCLWHKADIRVVLGNVRYWSNSGQVRASALTS